MNIYRAKFQAVCPNNGKTILYDLEIRSRNVIMVEDILAACDFKSPAYHEKIADHIRDRIPGLQVLRAHHHGVDIETIRGRK
jgi:hypothetical protein